MKKGNNEDYNHSIVPVCTISLNGMEYESTPPLLGKSQVARMQENKQNQALFRPNPRP